MTAASFLAEKGVQILKFNQENTASQGRQSISDIFITISEREHKTTGYDQRPKR